MKTSEALSTKFWPSVYLGLAIDVFLLVFAISLFRHEALFIFYIALFVSVLSKVVVLLVHGRKMKQSDLFWIRSGSLICIVISIVAAIIVR